VTKRRRHGAVRTPGVPDGLRDLFEELVVVAPWVRVDRSVPSDIFVPDEAGRAAGYLVTAGAITPSQASPVEEFIREARPRGEGEFVAFLYICSVEEELDLARLVARELRQDQGLGAGQAEIAQRISRTLGDAGTVSYLVGTADVAFELVGAVESAGGATRLMGELDKFVVENFADVGDSRAR